MKLKLVRGSDGHEIEIETTSMRWLLFAAVLMGSAYKDVKVTVEGVPDVDFAKWEEGRTPLHLEGGEE